MGLLTRRVERSNDRAPLILWNAGLGQLSKELQNLVELLWIGHDVRRDESGERCERILGGRRLSQLWWQRRCRAWKQCCKLRWQTILERGRWELLKGWRR